MVARLGQINSPHAYRMLWTKAINAEIIRIRGNSDVTILPNVNT